MLKVTAKIVQQALNNRTSATEEQNLEKPQLANFGE